MIPQIHDRLFRSVFRDRREAAALLRPHLPESLAESLDWSTLSLADRSYVDDDVRASELDLLFTITRAEDHKPLSLYVLLEWSGAVAGGVAARRAVRYREVVRTLLAAHAGRRASAVAGPGVSAPSA